MTRLARWRVACWHSILRWVERRQDRAFERLVDREQNR